jgi:hypothetical protein
MKKRGVVDLNKYFVNGKFQSCSLAEDIVFDEQGENKGIYVLTDNDDILVWTGKHYVIDKRGKFIKGMAQRILGNSATEHIRYESSNVSGIWRKSG